MAKKKATPRRRRPPAPKPQATVADGTIETTVQGGPYDGKTLTFDVMMVKLASEPLQTKHKLQTLDGVMHGTPEFAMALSERLKQLGYDCTPAIAIWAWIASCDYLANAQKKTS